MVEYALAKGLHYAASTFRFAVGASFDSDASIPPVAKRVGGESRLAPYACPCLAVALLDRLMQLHAEYEYVVC